MDTGQYTGRLDYWPCEGLDEGRDGGSVGGWMDGWILGADIRLSNLNRGLRMGVAVI